MLFIAKMILVVEEPWVTSCQSGGHLQSRKWFAISKVVFDFIVAIEDCHIIHRRSIPIPFSARNISFPSFAIDGDSCFIYPESQVLLLLACHSALILDNGLPVMMFKNTDAQSYIWPLLITLIRINISNSLHVFGEFYLVI